MDVVHEGLDDDETEPTLFFACLFALPGSVVVDRNRDAWIGEGPSDVDEVRGGFVRMFDRVRERLRRGEEHLEGIACPDALVFQPRAEASAHYRYELGARL